MLTRRLLLGSAAGALAGAASGCVPGPTIIGGPTAPPPVPPLPELPGAADARAREAALVALARGVAERGGAADDLVAAHEARLLALRHPRPELRATGEPTPQPGFTPPPVPDAGVRVPADRDGAVRALRDRLGPAADAYAGLARDAAAGDTDSTATRGSVALFWASLAAACRAEAVAVGGAPRPALVVTAPAALPETAEDDVIAAALAQVHAVIFTLQTALGAIGGDEARRLEGMVGDLRLFRDRLRATLTDRDVTAPAAEPAYEVPVLAGDTGAARRLVAETETRFTPHLGRLVAASPDLRETATDALGAAHAMAVGFGAPLELWPGWPAAG